MVQTSLNAFDLVVFTIVGLSALMAFYRGLVREIMSLGSWIGASVITLYAFPKAGAALEPQLGSAAAAGGLAAIGVFLVSLVLISVVGGLLLKFFKTGSDIGMLDHLMGLFFGLARGALIVALGFFIFSFLTPEKEYPGWLKTSISKPYVQKLASGVAELAPDYLDKLVKKAPEAAVNATQKIPGILDAADSLKSDITEKGEPKETSPSIEDLQERMREENELNNAR